MDSPVFHPHVTGFPSLPTQGNSLKRQFEDHGYQVVINVSDDPMWANAQWYRGNGIEYYWFPMGDCGPMGLQPIYGAILAIHEAERRGLKVLTHCFLPGTLIGAEVPLPIEDVKGGVIGHDGQLHPVVHNFKRDFDGDIVVVKSTGTLPLRLTPNHRLLVLRAYRWPNGKIAKPGHHDHVTPVKGWYNREPEWIRADELQQSDYLLSAQWVPDDTNSNHDKDVVWALGLFAADGNIDENSVNYTLSINTDYERVISALSKMGYNAFVAKETLTYRRIRVNSRQASKQFLEWFGRGAQNKHLPAWLMRTNPAALVAGVMAGDGTIAKRGNGSRMFTSTSRVLAYQIWQLVIAQGYKPYMRELKRYSGYANAKQGYAVEWTEPSGAHSKTTWWVSAGGVKYYVMPIVSLAKEHYCGPVYNCEVESVNSYHVQGIAVHNCAAGINRSQCVMDAYWFMSRGYYRTWQPPMENIKVNWGDGDNGSGTKTVQWRTMLERACSNPANKLPTLRWMERWLTAVHVEMKSATGIQPGSFDNAYLVADAERQ